MEDERFRELVARVINFNWVEPRPSAARTEYEAGREHLQDSWRASTDEAEKAGLWSKWKAPAPSAVRAEYDVFRKRLRGFQRALRSDFPEWHFSEGARKGQFVGGEGSLARPEQRRKGIQDGSLQDDLRKVWRLASEREADKAKRKLRKMSEGFMRKAERALSTTASYSMLGKHEKEAVPRKPRPKEAAALTQMVETLEWLQNRLGSLHVCENPKCASGRKYFFKIYPNDRYCCTRCIGIAKALRKAERDAQKPKKVPTFSDETRHRMGLAAEKRWAKKREADEWAKKHPGQLPRKPIKRPGKGSA